MSRRATEGYAPNEKPSPIGGGVGVGAGSDGNRQAATHPNPSLKGGALSYLAAAVALPAGAVVLMVAAAA